MEKTIQTLKLDNRELIEELQAICDKNTDIHRKLLRKVRDKEVAQAINELVENNRSLIKVIVILEYLEELEK